MNKFDYQFKKRLEHKEISAPENMWSKISAELNDEHSEKGNIRSFGWMWKAASAAALVISIVSIALIGMDRSGNNNGAPISEVNGDIDGYGTGFEKPFFSADKFEVAFGTTEEESNNAVANVGDDETSTPDQVSSPTYSMKILNNEEVSGTEYEILGPDESVSEDAAIEEISSEEGEE